MRETVTTEHGEYERVVVRRGKRRRQITFRGHRFEKNPEKYTLAKGGDWEVFSYPYGNPVHVFLRVGKSVEVFEVTDLRRLFDRLSGRLKRYRLRLIKGVRRRDIGGCSLLKAYNSGIEAIRRQKSPK